MRLRTRLTLVAAVAVAVTVVVVSTVAYLVVSDHLKAEVDDSLRSSIGRLAKTPFPEAALPYLGLTSSGPQYYVQIVNADGRTETPKDQTVELPVGGTALDIARGTRTSIHLADATSDGLRLRVITAPTAIRGKAWEMARSLDDLDRTLGDLRLTLGTVAALGVVAAALLGLLVSRAALRPVRRLTRAAEHVAATQDLRASIDVRGRDEVARLAASLNAMLAALDASRQQQRELISDASHELRTPLTSLRTNLELLAKHPDMSEPERGRLLSDVSSQIVELTALMDDLVELAGDHAVPHEPVTDIALDELVNNAVNRARLRTPGVAINVHVETPSRLRGKREHLERALVNLLDNACKWNGSDQPVDVNVRRNTITIRDRGPGIAPEDLPRVFDRFYRAPTARPMPGSGLGLAIVRHIVDDHGGSVALEPAPGGGTIATMQLLVTPAPTNGTARDPSATDS